MIGMTESHHTLNRNNGESFEFISIKFSPRYLPIALVLGTEPAVLLKVEQQSRAEKETNKEQANR